jgi:hypothetical protein
MDDFELCVPDRSLGDRVTEVVVQVSEQVVDQPVDGVWRGGNEGGVVRVRPAYPTHRVSEPSNLLPRELSMIVHEGVVPAVHVVDG